MEIEPMGPITAQNPQEIVDLITFAEEMGNFICYAVNASKTYNSRAAVYLKTEDLLLTKPY